MDLLNTFAISALLLTFTFTGPAEAKYRGGGSGASAAGSGTTAGAPAMTGRLGDQVFLMDADRIDNDSAGVSTCYDACAQNWPPLLAAAGTDLPGGYSLIERTDGTRQVAYNDRPLYLWAQDVAPGQMTGDGVNGVWRVARP